MMIAINTKNAADKLINAIGSLTGSPALLVCVGFDPTLPPDRLVCRVQCSCFCQRCRPQVRFLCSSYSSGTAVTAAKAPITARESGGSLACCWSTGQAPVLL